MKALYLVLLVSQLGESPVSKAHEGTVSALDLPAGKRLLIQKVLLLIGRGGKEDSLDFFDSWEQKLLPLWRATNASFTSLPSLPQASVKILMSRFLHLQAGSLVFRHEIDC